MQLAPDLWIAGPYYIEIDHLGQLLIVGPNNHLHFGSVGLKDYKVESVALQGTTLQIRLSIGKTKLFWHDPAIGHIQRVRQLIEIPGRPRPSFEEVYKSEPRDISPIQTSLTQTPAGSEIAFRRVYHRHWYGVRLQLGADIITRRDDEARGFWLESSRPLILNLLAETSEPFITEIQNVVATQDWSTASFGKNKASVDKLLQRTATEITHLVGSNKTSGFDYGTVFPRDWMESADLGIGDLTPEAVQYMYRKSFEFVDRGEGWHENAVGEFEFEKQNQHNELVKSLEHLLGESSQPTQILKSMIYQRQQLNILRNMVDIEPRYLLGLNYINAKDLSRDDKQRLRDVAAYILRQARDNHLITFKKLPQLLRRHRQEEYYSAGNWRDSEHAYKLVHPVIAPYDVNAVFYPMALETIAQHARFLKADAKVARQLANRWSRVKDWYRFDNADGQPAYALALYDVNTTGQEIEFKKLEVNHTDEAYDLFYGQPDAAQLISFCQRLINPDYFYTPSGPTVVGAGDGYDTKGYHGRVIWTKQTAYVAAGLARQLKRTWTPPIQQLINQALEATLQSSIAAFLKLGEVPELHYDKNGQPHAYNDQPEAEGPMNRVQLWSAVGARRIIRTYLETHHGSGA